MRRLRWRRAVSRTDGPEWCVVRLQFGEPVWVSGPKFRHQAVRLCVERTTAASHGAYVVLRITEAARLMGVSPPRPLRHAGAPMA